MTKVTLTKIPQLNSVVIKQTEGHLFISAPNSIVIDKRGFLELLFELGKIDFIDTKDLRLVREKLAEYQLEEVRKQIETEDDEWQELGKRL